MPRKYQHTQELLSDAMRSTHAPQACITDEDCITHVVRITFRKERITQKTPFCLVDKRDFFVGAGDRARTGTGKLPRDFKSRASANSATPACGLVHCSIDWRVCQSV